MVVDTQMIWGGASLIPPRVVFVALE